MAWETGDNGESVRLTVSRPVPRAEGWGEVCRVRDEVVCRVGGLLLWILLILDLNGGE